MNKTLASFIWGLTGTFLFTIIFASGKFIGGEIASPQILFVRFVSGFILLFCIMIFTQHKFQNLKSKNRKNHFFRAFTGSLGGACFIQAALLSPIADVTAIGLTDALLTILLCVIILKEKVSILQICAASTCAIGALVVILGSSEDGIFESISPGIWLALLGAFLIAVESILIKFVSNSDNVLTILLYANGFSLLIMILPAAYFWVTPSSSQIGGMLLLGPIAIAAQGCWVMAYKLADAALVTPINYTWIIFASLLGYFYFDETIGVLTAVGSAFIVIGGVILVRIKRYESKI